MSLARVHNPLSLALIRRLGDAGGPRADHVAAELDSLIAWARVSPRCIHRDTTATGNVGGGLDTLHSFSLPANSLEANGDYLHVRYSGSLANNANTKRVQVAFDGQVVSNSGGFGIGARAWTVDNIYIRVSATSVRAAVIYLLGDVNRDSAGTVSGNGLHSAGNITVTVANLNSNAVNLIVQGESGGSATDDIVQNFSIIELCQQKGLCLYRRET